MPLHLYAQNKNEINPPLRRVIVKSRVHSNAITFYDLRQLLTTNNRQTCLQDFPTYFLVTDSS